MPLLKNKFLPILGMLILAFFILISYQNHFLFLEELVVSSVILSIIFFFKFFEPIGIKEQERSNKKQINSRK